jgi:gluconolactonase
MPVYGVERPRALSFQGVYRLPPGGGEPQLLVDRFLFDQPNGLCFCPTEERLYVNDTVQALIRVFDMRPDGTPADPRGRVFAEGIRSELEPGVPDGMKCDARGNVWVTAPGGVWVYTPGGELLGKVRIPELAGNLHWGGADFRTLFVTATHSVYTVPTKVGPRLEPFMRPRRAAAGSAGEGASTGAPDRPAAPPPNGAEQPAARPPAAGPNGGLDLDPRRCALIIQDMQNDVVMEGGAFASSGSPAHARAQNVVENIRRLADACRARGVMVIHVWFVVEPGAPGMTLNAPLFEGVVDNNALVRGTWGAAPVPGLEPKPGDMVVEKMRMSAWEGTRLETLLRSGERTVLINTGAWTNMSVEHTARTGADKGYFIVLPEDCCSTMNAAWHDAAVNYALQNVAAVTRTDAVLAALR